MRFDKSFILVAFVCLLGGEALGEWMGATQNLQYAPIHAHINLAGWVTLALYGVLHRLYPELGKARLAWPQFLLSVLSLPVFFYGIYVVLTDPKSPVLVGAGSLAFLIGTLLFLIMFIGKVVTPKSNG
jgi:hypothetical protein